MMKVFLHSFRIHDTKKQQVRNGHLEIPCPGHKLPQEISKAGMRIKENLELSVNSRTNDSSPINKVH